MNVHNTKDRSQSRSDTQPSGSKNRKAKEEIVPAKSANSGTTSHASSTTGTASGKHRKPGKSENNGEKKRPGLISALSSGLSSSGSSECLEIMVKRLRIEQQKNLKTPAWASVDKSHENLVTRVKEIDRRIAELKEERSEIIMVVLPKREIELQQWNRRLDDLDEEGEELEKRLEHFKGILEEKDYNALGKKAKSLALKNRSEEEKERDNARDQTAEAREKKEWEAYNRKLEGNEPRKEKEREHRKGGGSDVESDSGKSSRKRGKKAVRPGQPGQSSQSQGSS
ncbi:hypothetical protein ACMFMG_010659 [Clarireedia jacksonii]